MTSLSMSCMNYLYICLYAKFEVLDDLRSIHALMKRIYAIKEGYNDQ
jgi:hypothetical protein